MNLQNTKVLKILLIAISVVVVIAIAVSIATDKPTASSGSVFSESSSSTTEPPTTEPQEIGLYTFTGSNENVMLIQIYAYKGKSVGISYYASTNRANVEDDRADGLLFRDNLVQFVRDVKSENDFRGSDVFPYQLHNNERLTFLGMDEYNNDFIIVERVSLGDATVFKCRECGDEAWYVLASDIDFSSRNIVEETDDYGYTIYSVWYDLK